MARPSDSFASAPLFNIALSAPQQAGPQRAHQWITGFCNNLASASVVLGMLTPVLTNTVDLLVFRSDLNVGCLGVRRAFQCGCLCELTLSRIDSRADDLLTQMINLDFCVRYRSLRMGQAKPTLSAGSNTPSISGSRERKIIKVCIGQVGRPWPLGLSPLGT